MRYMLMFKSDQNPEPGVSPCKQHLPEMAKVMEELKQSGVLVATEGLLPSDSGARVRLAGSDLRVLDGPFAEAKEVVAGFAVVNVKSKAEAVQLAKRFLEIAGGGECDVLEVFDAETANH